MESQLESPEVECKESQINLGRIVEMFDVDRQSVQSQRSADFRRSKEAIMTRRQQPGSCPKAATAAPAADDSIN